MDDQNAGEKRDDGNLACRPPVEADVAALCHALNTRGAKYIVIGGFAIIAAGLPRLTADVDLLVAADAENEARVFSALSTLPDNAVSELRPGELQQHNIIRVADEFLVDLMRSACGIEYAEASAEVVVHEVRGVPIPFASPRLLWRMKANTHREKDAPDLYFLRRWFAERGEEPPKV
jgi:hypothetical protein